MVTVISCQVVVSKMDVCQHVLHGVSPILYCIVLSTALKFYVPDGHCYERVVAVTGLLPDHFPARYTVVPGMKKARFHTPKYTNICKSKQFFTQTHTHTFSHTHLLTHTQSLTHTHTHSQTHTDTFTDRETHTTTQTETNRP